MEMEDYLERVRNLKPPYKCPLIECGKKFRSFHGMRQHVLNFDHSDPEAYSRQQTPKNRAESDPKLDSHLSLPPPKREAMTWAEAQKLVEIDHKGRLYRINIYEPLEVITDRGDLPRSSKPLPKQVSPKNLPKAVFTVQPDYKCTMKVPERPKEYYKFVEFTQEELDAEIEYDMDDEDHAWLGLITDIRAKAGKNPVSQDTFEFLMDRFEKEAFFQSQTNGSGNKNNGIDDEAVCSICLDGDCQNTNVILFCDMCNLAVHQECYGVPYVLFGQLDCSFVVIEVYTKRRFESAGGT